MDLISINSVANRLGLSVHQLRRWELMFALEIRRGRGQQRQYRPEDVSVLERIKELVEQGWPTTQIRPQLEAEGLLTPKLIGMPSQVGEQEILVESVIGLRNFVERRFIELSNQIEELRQLFITICLKQELQGELDSPWQPLAKELASEMRQGEAEEIAIGPSAGPSVGQSVPAPSEKTEIVTSHSPPPSPMGLGEITDQNYLTVLGRALDLVTWTDEQADEYSSKHFGVPHWDELGRSQAETLINHLAALLKIKPLDFDLCLKKKQAQYYHEPRLKKQWPVVVNRARLLSLPMAALMFYMLAICTY